MAEEFDPGEGFRRQRKGLMAMATVLIILHGADAVPTETITISWISLDLNNPIFLVAMLWVVWFYYLCRYSVFVFESDFSSMWNKGFRQWIFNNPRVFVSKRLAISQDQESGSVTTDLTEDRLLIDKAVIKFPNQAYGDSWGVPFQASIPIVGRSRPGSESMSSAVNVSLPRWRGRYGQFRSLLHMLFVDRLGSEYVWPMIYGIAPVFVAVFMLFAYPEPQAGIVPPLSESVPAVHSEEAPLPQKSIHREESDAQETQGHEVPEPPSPR